MKQVKTIDEIKLRTWISLVEIIDLSPDNDWEKIGTYTNTFEYKHDLFILTSFI